VLNDKDLGAGNAGGGAELLVHLGAEGLALPIAGIGGASLHGLIAQVHAQLVAAAGLHLEPAGADGLKVEGELEPVDAADELPLVLVQLAGRSVNDKGPFSTCKDEDQSRRDGEKLDGLKGP